LLAYIDKVIEVALIALLLVEDRQAQRRVRKRYGRKRLSSKQVGDFLGAASSRRSNSSSAKTP